MQRIMVSATLALIFALFFCNGCGKSSATPEIDSVMPMIIDGASAEIIDMEYENLCEAPSDVYTSAIHLQGK